MGEGTTEKGRRGEGKGRGKWERIAPLSEMLNTPLQTFMHISLSHSHHR